ncbi:hypothetical protein MMC11_005331 [Xylographa trunciseda]|nr:hypothetical protein [Xylographa trunciseda]
MRTSSYFNEVLFHDPDPTTDQLFERKTAQLFELKDSCLHLHVQSVHENSRREQQIYGDLVKCGSLAPLDFSTDGKASRPAGCSVDRLCYVPFPPPPLYNRHPGLHFQVITKPEELRTAGNSHDRKWHSYSRFRLTRELFEELMSDFDIFPRFRELVLLFGSKHGENEIGPPQMRFRKLVHNAKDPIDSFCTGFECAYGLRYVELNSRKGTTEPWSVRQTVVYHKYIMAQQSSTWVLIAASSTTELRIDRYVKSFDKLANLNPFEIHLIILDTALANWRPYIIFLTEKITTMSDAVLVADIDGKGDGLPLGVQSRQQLKDLEDQIIDFLLILDSTYDTVLAFGQKYEQYCHSANESSINLDESLDSIQLALQEKQREVELLQRKVKALHKKVNGTISLLSSLLDLGTGNSLKELAEEARKENITMRLLTEKGTRDAAAVKVLTMITLIYLPATVVSNFFSTQFVSQQQNSLIVAENAWLFAAISVPLTAATILIWWLWVQLQAKQVFRIKWKDQLFIMVEKTAYLYQKAFKLSRVDNEA